MSNLEITKIDLFIIYYLQKYFKEAYSRTRALMQKLQPALTATKTVLRKQ